MASKVKAGSAYVEVYADNSKLSRDLRKAQSLLGKFSKNAKSLGGKLSASGLAIGTPIAMAVRSFASFDDQMRMVQAATQTTEADFQKLTKTAQHLGATTSWTAAQVAEGMVSLGRMGFNPREIEAAIGPMMDLARATGTDVATAAEIAGNNLRVFKLEASQMTRVADILTVTANGSAQNLYDLGEALKFAGPQAAAVGEDITDVAAALGVMANMGIKGSLAGTALRRAYSQFGNPKIQALLSGYGIRTVDNSGNLRKMRDVMVDIARVMATMPSAEKMKFVTDVFDIRGSLAGFSLGGNIEQLDAFLKKLDDVDGAARRTAKNMDQGLGNQFKIVISAIEGLAHAFSEQLKPELMKVGDQVIRLAKSFTRFIQDHPGVAKALVATAAGLTGMGAALLGLSALSGVFAKVISGGLMVAKVMKAISMTHAGTQVGLFALELGVANNGVLTLVSSLGTLAAAIAAAFAGYELGQFIGKITGLHDWLEKKVGTAEGRYDVNDDDMRKYYKDNIVGTKRDHWDGNVEAYLKDRKSGRAEKIQKEAAEHGRVYTDEELGITGYHLNLFGELDRLRTQKILQYEARKTAAENEAKEQQRLQELKRQEAAEKDRIEKSNTAYSSKIAEFEEALRKAADARIAEKFMKELEDLIKKNPDQGKKKAQEEISRLSHEATLEYNRYHSEAQKAAEDGKIDDNERATLNEISNKYLDIQRRIDSINDMVAQAASSDRVNRVSGSFGSFGSYSALAASIGGITNEQLEIAKRSERYLRSIDLKLSDEKRNLIYGG